VSNLNTFLDETVTVVAALNLTLNAVAVPVVRSKLPQKRENVAVPRIYVCSQSSGPEDSRPFSAERKSLVSYLIGVHVISANNEDQSTNLATYTNWRETIRRTFQRPPLGAVTVFNLRPAPGVFLPPDLIHEEYDYQSVFFRVETIEDTAA
jgi:hypothetical protein